MSSIVNKYEATGIFVSITIMIAALAVISMKVDDGLVSSAENVSVQGAVVVVSEDGVVSDEAALADAIVDASTEFGTLQALVVDDVRIGTGNAAAVGNTVTVHYIGSTRDGVQFDSSYERGESFTFTLGEGKVIKGWEDGLVGMKVGGQRILVVPPEMGYGNRQVGPIAAGSILVFAVELLSIR